MFDLETGEAKDVGTPGAYAAYKAPAFLHDSTSFYLCTDEDAEFQYLAYYDIASGKMSRGFDINPYSYALNTSRTLDPSADYISNYAPFNILHELDNNYIEINMVDVKFQGELKWKVIQGLELSALGAVRYQTSVSYTHLTLPTILRV